MLSKAVKSQGPEQSSVLQGLSTIQSENRPDPNLQPASGLNRCWRTLQGIFPLQHVIYELAMAEGSAASSILPCMDATPENAASTETFVRHAVQDACGGNLVDGLDFSEFQRAGSSESAWEAAAE